MYVDGFNPYYSSLKKSSLKWLDIQKLVRRILPSHHNIVKMKYFTARVKSSPSDSTKPERQSAYWRALKSIPDVEIVKGCFKTREVNGRLISPLRKGLRKRSIVKIEKYEEKESDVNIATHIVWDSAQQDIDCIVLLSNDTDLKLPLWVARKKFHKIIGVITPWHQRIHNDLQKISRFNYKITRQDLEECQFPEKVGNARKPNLW